MYILEPLEKFGCMKYLYNKFEAVFLPDDIVFKIWNKLDAKNVPNSIP